MTCRPISLTQDELRLVLEHPYRSLDLVRPTKLTQKGDFVRWPCEGQPNPHAHCYSEPARGEYHFHYRNGFNHSNIPCPWGRSEDELWVRETFRPTGWDDQPLKGHRCLLAYKFDGGEAKKPMPIDYLERWTAQLDQVGEGWWNHWRPSMQMPKWASRLRLAVLTTRPELRVDGWVWTITVERRPAR